jgi:hypothetical protein
MSWSFNPLTGNLDLVGAGALVFEGEVPTFADLPVTIGDPAIGAAYLVRDSTGVWLVNRRQAGIYIRRNNTGVAANDWEYGGDYPVNSVNGMTGDVVLNAFDVGAAELTHNHQPGEVLADAAFVTQSGSNTGRSGIYLRNGSDNNRPRYESPTTGDYIWWDSNLDIWYLSNRAGLNLYYLEENADQFPWETDAVWLPIPNQNGGLEVDQATLFDVSDYSSTSVVGLKTAKSGNATSTELVLGSDTRLTDARTPTTHASTHHTGGSDALTPLSIGAESLFTTSSFTVSGTTTTLSAGRAQIVTIIALSATTINLPTTGNQHGDRLVIRGGSPLLGTITLSATLVSDTITAQGQQRSYVWQNTGTGDRWVLNSVDTHTHPASAISDSTTAGRELLTAATVQAQRTALDTFVSAANFASFPVSGNFQRVYLALDTQKTYVWNGSGYTEASPNNHARVGAANINVGETALASASLSGNNNTAVGVNALLFNTTGSENSAYGTNALSANYTGTGNSAFGTNALKNSIASNNTAFGSNALKWNQTGVNNVAIGISSLESCDSYNNTATGQGSLYACISGHSNAALGLNAGLTLQSGYQNTLLGTQSDVDSQGRNMCVVIGAGATSPAVDGSLSIGGTGGNAMGNIVTASGGTSANQDLIIYLNGTRYRIALKT